MKSDYIKLKEKYKILKRQRDFFEVDCSNKDLEIRKLKKKIYKLEKENYELICLLSVKEVKHDRI